MRLLTPLDPVPTAPLARANPVAKLAAAGLVLVALFLSLDGVTALIVLAGLAALVPFSGIRPGPLLGRGWLIGLAALSVGAVNMLFAADPGPTLFVIGPLRIGEDAAIDGLGLAVRVLAIGFAGVLAVATSQPIDLADALIQQLHVSPRFAVGALAAVRMVPLLAVEWQTIGLARRARGVDAGRSPVAAVRLAFGRILGLLVAAIRRASRLATAMDSRGFGALPCRTVARVQRMRLADWGWIAGAGALAALAVEISMALGTWRPLLG